MNMVDGVKIRNMRKAPGIWRDFMNDPEGFWARDRSAGRPAPRKH